MDYYGVWQGSMLATFSSSSPLFPPLFPCCMLSKGRGSDEEEKYEARKGWKDDDEEVMKTVVRETKGKTNMKKK